MSNDKREKALEKAKKELRSEVDRDQLLVKAMKQLDQADKSLRKEVERFRDWYSLHFPELEGELESDEEFVKILSKEVKREDLDAFSSLAEESNGKEFLEEDLDILQQTADRIRSDLEYREELEQYIRDLAREEMPNLSELLGPVLTAKMVALSGGLEDLAKSPSSTIQMLGAEKALFRHLRGGGKPPKHGVLFEHQFVSSLPEEVRGKMARFLANKAAMAARLDLYGDKRKGEKLWEEAQEKFEELKN